MCSLPCSIEMKLSPFSVYPVEGYGLAFTNSSNVSGGGTEQAVKKIYRLLGMTNKVRGNVNACRGRESVSLWSCKNPFWAGRKGRVEEQLGGPEGMKQCRSYREAEEASWHHSTRDARTPNGNRKYLNACLHAILGTDGHGRAPSNWSSFLLSVACCCSWLKSVHCGTAAMGSKKERRLLCKSKTVAIH